MKMYHAIATATVSSKLFLLLCTSLVSSMISISPYPIYEGGTYWKDVLEKTEYRKPTYYGGTYWEDVLETPIDLREPRSFPQTELLVVRQNQFTDVTDAHGKSVSIGNWEVYTEKWWYETRLVNASCPQVPIGIAATTDWSLMCTCLFGNPTVLPKTIFVHTLMLPHFAESTLKFMNVSARFILITGGMDMTIPFGTGDSRYRKVLRYFGNSQDGGMNFDYIINNPRVLHWYAENHDIEHPKMSTLPTGYIHQMIDHASQEYLSYNYESIENLKKPVSKRKVNVLTADRVRDRTGQWAARYNVEEMCSKVSWCHVPIENLQNGGGINHEDFVKLLHQHSFITCVHGGGMDPSPKAFEAIHEGTIPILRKTMLYDAYKHLPVMWINEWDEFFHAENTTKVLQYWHDKLAPYYEPNSALRQETLNKLRTSFWIELLDKKYHKEMTKEKNTDSDASQKLTEEKKIHPDTKLRRPKRSLRSMS